MSRLEITRGVAVVAALVAAMTAGAPAYAQVTMASGGFLSDRPCTGASATTSGTDCVLGRRTVTLPGGAGGGFSASDTLPSGSSHSASVVFGADYLPTIRLGTVAGITSRTATSAFALRAFTYSGDAINLAFSGAAHFFKGTGAIPGESVERSYFGATLGIVPVSTLTGFNADSSAEDFFNSYSSLVPVCGDGVASAASFVGSDGLAPGEHSLALNLSSTCSGGAIRINPGDQFVIVALLQAIGNRGGFIDATHTFDLNYDLLNTTFAATGAPVGAAYLTANLAGVPEPSLWATMILGFGLVGAMLRRRGGRRGERRGGRRQIALS